MPRNQACPVSGLFVRECPVLGHCTRTADRRHFLLAQRLQDEYPGCKHMRVELRQLEARIIETASQIDSLTGQLLLDLRRVDEEKGWRARGAISCLHWLTSQLGWDRGTASERIRVARRLASLPQTDAAYLAGELSYSKVRALVRVATPES